MQYQYINSQAALDACCHAAAKSAFIALDTEFVRTRTFYPALGLIQMNDGEQLSLIDVQAVENWDSFISLLKNEQVIKVLHSCSEDLEVFWHHFGAMPAPVFDTQFAAGLCGYGAAMGYGRLVEAMLGITLDKGESRTDWLQRPLSPKQLDYAANDVIYLFQLFPILRDKLDESGRTHWVFEDLAQLAHKKSHPIPPEFHYLQIKNNWQLNGKSLAVLQALALWRMKTAKERDSALNFIVKETSLLDIAQKQPCDKGALAGLGCMHGRELRLFGDDIVAIVREAIKREREQWPAKVTRLSERSHYKKVLHELREICLGIAERENIPSELLASKNQINHLLKWHWLEVNEFAVSQTMPDLACSWRKPLVFEPIMAVLNR